MMEMQMEGSVDVAQESFGTASEGGEKDEKKTCNWVLLNIKVKKNFDSRERN